MSGPPHPRPRPPGAAAWTCRDSGPSRPAQRRRKLPTCIALAAALTLPTAPASAHTAPAQPTTPASAPTSPAQPAAAATATPTPAPAAPAPTPGEIPPQPPRDPNDAPFMRPPNNQPRPMGLRTSPDLRRGYSSIRRIALTIVPVFASFRLPFLCRPTDNCTPGAGATPTRQHGAGIGGELDVQVIRWLWLRAQASYSLHPIQDVRVTDDKGNVSVVAPGGTIRALGFGVGPVVALDLGRFIPLIEGGIGALRVATPAGLSDGQMGEACLEGGICDVGLTCGGDNTCRQGLIADLYFGGAVDVLVRRHLSLGIQIRYHALITAPGKFPVYLIGGLRLGVRF